MTTNPKETFFSILHPLDWRRNTQQDRPLTIPEKITLEEAKAAGFKGFHLPIQMNAPLMHVDAILHPNICRLNKDEMIYLKDSLVARFEAERAKVAKLREALEIYESAMDSCDGEVWGDGEPLHTILDCYSVYHEARILARKALEETKV